MFRFELPFFAGFNCGECHSIESDDHIKEVMLQLIDLTYLYLKRQRDIMTWDIYVGINHQSMPL